MKIVMYASREQAELRWREANASAGLPRVHREGPDPADYRIACPGRAEARIRARGIRTDQALEMLVSHDGTRFGIRDDADPRATEIDAREWLAPPDRELR